MTGTGFAGAAVRVDAPAGASASGRLSPGVKRGSVASLPASWKRLVSVAEKLMSCCRSALTMWYCESCAKGSFAGSAARLAAVSLPALTPGLRRYFSPYVVKVLTWGGLRGGISVAMALSLPPSDSREPLVAVTYIVVVFSILVQGLTIGRLLRGERTSGEA